MGLLDFISNKAMLNTFQNDFDKFRTANKQLQIQVGQKIFCDVMQIMNMSADTLNSSLPILRKHYQHLRHQALEHGATNELNPEYAYAALMESLVLSIGHDEIFNKINNDILGWLSLLGVIEKK